jgi:predicted Zn-dependent protease
MLPPKLAPSRDRESAMRAACLLVVLLLAALVVGCENPVTIDRETEIQIGREGAAELEGKYGVVQDAAAEARLEGIGRRITAVTEEPSFPWTLKVLNTSEVNALALPGGFVYITKGMMGYVKNDDELAGVIGHEAVHVSHHHAKSEIEKAMTASLLVELVTQKSSDAIRQAAGIALDLEMRQGYREKEYEADQYGTGYAYRAGYRAEGLRQVLARLHEDKGDPGRLTWLLQSHPPLSKRIERLDQYVPTLAGEG